MPAAACGLLFARAGVQLVLFVANPPLAVLFCSPTGEKGAPLISDSPSKGNDALLYASTGCLTPSRSTAHCVSHTEPSFETLESQVWRAEAVGMVVVLSWWEPGSHPQLVHALCVHPLAMNM